MKVSAWLFLGAAAAAAWGAFAVATDDHAAKVAAAPSPASLVSLIVDEPAAHAAVLVKPPLASVTLDLAPWALTVGSMRSTFNMITAQLVPALFARFPAIGRIEIEGDAPFRDIRGNNSSLPALRVAFNRSNADRVQWHNVVFDDVPKFADTYWAAPGFASP